MIKGALDVARHSIIRLLSADVPYNRNSPKSLSFDWQQILVRCLRGSPLRMVVLNSTRFREEAGNESSRSYRSPRGNSRNMKLRSRDSEMLRNKIETHRLPPCGLYCLLLDIHTQKYVVHLEVLDMIDSFVKSNGILQRDYEDDRCRPQRHVLYKKIHANSIMVADCDIQCWLIPDPAVANSAACRQTWKHILSAWLFLRDRAFLPNIAKPAHRISEHNPACPASSVQR